ncbi:Defense-related protein containing SCP domain [Handroanthus impetiginosus]|uniref:Defense-related protein containing SCP domain n=1 Tax=Handroanthus impetiginosus TaxID=429701 RepID=A0A2G9HFA2_9LAMI|nr:Defense-related protein containing SCP domain [Handroanthus impetiginosus]
MENHKKFSLPILLLFVVLTTLQYSCQAHNSPQDYVNAHNRARAEVRVGPIRWDETVAAFARNYVNSRLGDCNLIHSGSKQYGENLAKGSGNFTGRAAVNLWVAEKGNYDYNSNSCVGGECHHYTQVVWRNSVRLGCARARCNNGWWFISCNYSPPGNIAGQRPYGFEI